MSVNPGDTILDLKERIEDQEGIRPEQQRLVSGGKTLLDGDDLGRYAIQEGSTLHLIFQAERRRYQPRSQRRRG